MIHFSMRSGSSFFKEVQFLFILVLFQSICLSSLISQNTVGLLSKTPKEFQKGYDLVYPFYQPTVFLLDSCGQIVHQWTDEDEMNPGLAAYLSPEGKLIKSKKHYIFQNDIIGGSPSGEFVEIYSWENELLASFELNNDQFRLHHDLEPMANGNVLMIAWDRVLADSLLRLGKDTLFAPTEYLLSEKIIEWNPTLDSIVWEWNAFDHVIQDFDSTLSNYGSVENHPEKIDLNFPYYLSTDWLHFNSIDYNEELDQILISCPEFNEFWIIDHSTSKEEAKGSSGGLSGKGGDLIFRWGNPQAYANGDDSDQKLFYQHDVNWTNSHAQYEDDDYGEIILFNNRVHEGSSVAYLDLQFDTMSWSYKTFFNDITYLPTDFERTISHPTNSELSHSQIVSSARKQPNGNTLIFAGDWGYVYEMNVDGDLVWEYRIPFNNGKRIEQGFDPAKKLNLMFKFIRYPLDFPAFEEKDLDPLEYLELSDANNVCENILPVNDLISNHILLYPRHKLIFL